jgi:hypothetical protein
MTKNISNTRDKWWLKFYEDFTNLVLSSICHQIKPKFADVLIKTCALNKSAVSTCDKKTVPSPEKKINVLFQLYPLQIIQRQNQPTRKNDAHRFPFKSQAEFILVRQRGNWYWSRKMF